MNWAKPRYTDTAFCQSIIDINLVVVFGSVSFEMSFIQDIGYE